VYILDNPSPPGHELSDDGIEGGKCKKGKSKKGTCKTGRKRNLNRKMAVNMKGEIISKGAKIRAKRVHEE
jgi:hypothetical protein